MAVMFSRGDKLENGHYTVIKEIGVGGMGVVYHCKDEQLMRDVAMKMLLPELMADKANLEVFHQEARLAAQLEHPNIVTVYDVGVEERQKKHHHYVCMEYLPGGNLANRVITGPLAVENCLSWMKQLASGLTYAHKRGVVHQDIKADNIFITTEGDLKIGDFGLARLLVGRVHLNAQTKGMGTPAYMSPELCRGEPQDHRSDIYSLGVLFFEMATGQLPFRARGMIEMATKHSSAPVPSAKRLNPLIPEILDKVIRRMMAKTPEERYSSMSEVLTILDDLIFELRVARLGLGNRPHMRSGNIQAELLAHAQAQAQAQQHVNLPGQTTVNPVPEPLEEAGWNRVRSSMKPDTEPHTTSLPPVDHSVAQKLASDRLKQNAMSPSEKLIAQLENTAVTGAVSPPNAVPPELPNLRSTPRRDTPRSMAAGHFVNTQQVQPIVQPGSEAIDSGSTAPISASATTPASSAPAAPATPAAASSSSSSSSSLKAGSQAGSVSNAGSSSVNARTNTGNPASDGGSIPTEFAPRFQPKGFASPRTSSSVLPKMRSGPLMQSLKAGLDLRWTFGSKGPIGWSSSPVVDKEERSVYFCSADGHLYCLDAENGQMRWSCNVGAPMLASPILSGDKVLVTCSNGLICGVSNRDGSLIWRFDSGDKLVATPSLYKDTLIVPGSSGKLLAVETDGGLQKWQFKAESGIVCAPQQHGNLVLFGTRGGEFYAVSSENGKKAWQFTAGSPITASPAASVDSVYFGSEGGTFFALDAETGRLSWEYPTDRPIVSKAVIAFTSVLFSSHDKWLYCCERYDGGLKWKGALRGKVMANLVATRDTAISVTREGWIQAFATNNGEIRWQRDLGRSLESAPLLTANHFYVGTVEGELVAYSFASTAVLAEKSA